MKSRRGFRGRAGRGRAFRHSARALGATAAAALALGGWLRVYGFPRFVRQRAVVALRDAGLDVTFSRLRLQWPAAVVADGATWRLHPEQPYPRVSAEALALRLDPLDRLRGGPGVRGIEVRDGRLELVAPPRGGARATGSRIDRVFGRARFEPAGLRIESLRADLFGMDLSAEGLVLGVGRPGAGRAARTGGLVPEGVLRQAPRLAAGLAQLDFPVRPAVRATFLVDPQAPDATEIDVTGSAAEARYRGLPVRGATLAWSARGARHRLEAALAVPPAGRLALRAALDTAADTVEGALSAELPLADAWAMPWPEGVRRTWTRLRPEGTALVRVEAETPGPVPRAGVLAAWDARVRVVRAGLLGAWFERFACGVERRGDRLRFHDIEAVVGRGRAAGPASGEVSVDLAARRYDGRGTAHFDPHEVLAWLPPGQAESIGSAQFPAEPPYVTAAFGGGLDRIETFRLEGVVAATNFLYHGGGVRSLHARLTYRDDTLRLDDVRVERPEGGLAGWAEMDYARERVRFEVDSRMNPHAVARAIGPAPHRFAQQLRFEGPCRIRARGLVDYGAYEATDLEGEVEGRALGVEWFLADEARFRVTMRGRRLRLEDVQGAYHGGAFAGAASFVLAAGGDGHTAYEASGTLANVDFAAAYRDIARQPGGSYRGRLYGEGRVAGRMGEGQGGTVTGEGRIGIRDGELFKIPLFGGLSRLLARLYPGLGFATQGDFSGTFAVADRKVVSEDARLLGGLLSVRARGAYRFDGRMKYAVQVQPMRKGPVAEVLRFLTFPVTKLFEFDLGGTLGDPVWEPRNLPKELFLLFE